MFLQTCFSLPVLASFVVSQTFLVVASAYTKLTESNASASIIFFILVLIVRVVGQEVGQVFHQIRQRDLRVLQQQPARLAL